MTNFEKVKEMWTIDMVIEKRTVSFCMAINKLRNEKSCGTIGCKKCLEWLAQEYKEPILDDVEKEYLSAVIKPFKNRVRGIEKAHDYVAKEYICITLYGSERIYLPYFKKGTMYKGMKYKEYSLKELGLE